MITRSIIWLSAVLLTDPLSAGLVTTTNDSGPGSLRDVIAAAVSGETISFDSVLNGQTIVLTNGPIQITMSLLVDASGLSDGLTLSGNTSSSIFITASATTNTLIGLTITEGVAESGVGGGIWAMGDLTLVECVIRNNQASQGGGIFNDFGAVLNLFRCAICNNTAELGGGVRSRFTFTIQDSTICSNSASVSGGGISVVSFGDLTLLNSTLANNHSIDGGGLDVGGSGTAAVRNSSIAGNTATNAGGGVRFTQIAAGASLTLENSIVADNVAEIDPNISGSVTASAGNNFLDADPKLAPLGDYGGQTWTMPPLPGSAVIEGAVLTPNSPMTDQRGAIRPSGPLPDIGAVEAVAFETLALDDTEPDGIPDLLEGTNGPYAHLIVGVDDSMVDADRDGSTDAAELASMTDPTDPNDNFRIQSMIPAADFQPFTNPTFEIAIRTFPGLDYELEAGDSLLSLHPLSESQITAADHSETLSVLLPPGNNQSYIRAKRH